MSLQWRELLSQRRLILNPEEETHAKDAMDTKEGTNLNFQSQNSRKAA